MKTTTIGVDLAKEVLKYFRFTELMRTAKPYCVTNCAGMELQSSSPIWHRV